MLTILNKPITFLSIFGRVLTALHTRKGRQVRLWNSIKKTKSFLYMFYIYFFQLNSNVRVLKQYLTKKSINLLQLINQWTADIFSRFRGRRRRYWLNKDFGNKDVLLGFFLSFRTFKLYFKNVLVKKLPASKIWRNQNNFITNFRSNKPYLRHFEINFKVAAFTVLPIPYLFFYSFLVDQSYLWRSLLMELLVTHR